MLYHHRGLGASFNDYHAYFDGSLDLDALAYLGLANKLIHSIHPNAITIAEDVSGLQELEHQQVMADVLLIYVWQWVYPIAGSNWQKIYLMKIGI